MNTLNNILQNRVAHYAALNFPEATDHEQNLLTEFAIEALEDGGLTSRPSKETISFVLAAVTDRVF